MQTSLESSVELLDGLGRGELILHYQPVFGVRSRRIERYEALARWEHPVRGHLLPDSFIDLTEHDGVGLPFTVTVLRRAISDCATWQADGSDAGVAVNLSPRLLAVPRLPGVVAGILDDAGLPATELTLELVEGTCVVDLDDMADMLATFAAMGVRLSLDDFGRADSSLTRLQRLPLHELKIDQAFVKTLPYNRTDATIVRFVSELGREFGLDVVGEGVEHPEALPLLDELGVTALQGFTLGRPAPLHALARAEPATW